MRAAALNHRDLKILAGLYHGVKPPQRVPAGDGVGEVVALGEGVAHWRRGDRVSAVHFLRWLDGAYPSDAYAEDLGSTHDGWLSEFVILPAAALVRVPNSISDLAAASIPSAGVTSWSALHDFGRIKKDDTVLTIGTGGVSAMTIRIARAAGARSILLSTSANKIERAAEVGISADISIDTSVCPDWPAEVHRQTDGADIVVETVGTATLGQSIAACALGGRIAFIGALGGVTRPTLDGLIAKNVTIKGIASGSRAMLQSLFDELAQQGFESIVGASFEFADVDAAYRLLERGGHTGKIVILGR